MSDEPPMASKPKRNEDGRILCDYCEMPAQLMEDSSPLYHGVNYGPAWVCPLGCGWVGCHKGTCKPLGRIANKELRRAKMDAHAAFDRLWQAKWRKERCSKKHARGAGYQWLAVQLGIDQAVCHIGMMNVAMCRRVVEVCRPYHGGRA